jgi:hypothetical protein
MNIPGHRDGGECGGPVSFHAIREKDARATEPQEKAHAEAQSSLRRVITGTGRAQGRSTVAETMGASGSKTIISLDLSVTRSLDPIPDASPLRPLRLCVSFLPATPPRCVSHRLTRRQPSPGSANVMFSDDRSLLHAPVFRRRAPRHQAANDLAGGLNPVRFDRGALLVEPLEVIAIVFGHAMSK